MEREDVIGVMQLFFDAGKKFILAEKSPGEGLQLLSRLKGFKGVVFQGLGAMRPEEQAAAWSMIVDTTIFAVVIKAPWEKREELGPPVMVNKVSWLEG